MNPLERVARRCRQLLSEQQITVDGPGTMLRDIGTLLEFIGPDGLKTKSLQGNLPAAALPAHCSLDELASAILDAFEFTDHDHLYEFRFRDHYGKGRVYYHPYTDEGPYADEIKVGSIGLPEKGVVRFLFDDGNSWRFKLQLERREPGRGRRPKLTGSAGRAPKQYPDGNEDDQWF
jgi:hypothetical protein